VRLSDSQTLGVTAVLLAVGLGALLASAACLGYAAARAQAAPEPSDGRSGGPVPRPTGAAPLGARPAPRAHWGLLALLAAWGGAALAASAGGRIGFGLVVPSVVLAVALGLALSFTPAVRALVAEVPTHWLVAIQTYRVAGGLFIYPYLAAGELTPGFALTAGVGDVLTGLAAPLVAAPLVAAPLVAAPLVAAPLVAAPLVAARLGRRGAGARGAFLAWSAFGVLDLAVAVAAAAAFGFGAPGVRPGFPITTIPLFFGPPFSILLHALTLRRFALRHGRGAGQGGR
jgi:hypothetical protein